MKDLQMSLKTKWFDMTKAKIKPEDYREITTYWAKRLLHYKPTDITLTNSEWQEMCNDLNKCFDADELDYYFDNWYLKFKSFNHNVMTLGYPKSGDTERIIKYEHAGIEIRTGNPEWGAEPDKLYFVIKHGKELTHKKIN